MTDGKDINRQIRQIYTKGNSIVNKFKACTEDVKAELFKIYCMNMYCCTLWANYSKAALKRLKLPIKPCLGKCSTYLLNLVVLQCLC